MTLSPAAGISSGDRPSVSTSSPQRGSLPPSFLSRKTQCASELGTRQRSIVWTNESSWVARTAELDDTFIDKIPLESEVVLLLDFFPRCSVVATLQDRVLTLYKNGSCEMTQ